MIKKLFTMVAFAMCAFAVNAADIDTSSLSPAQIAELKAIAAKAASANAQAKSESSNPSNVLSVAAGWGKQASEAAEGFGKAFTVAAKELGITANEFLSTPAGKLTAALIIWKVMGATIVKMLFGVFFITTGLTIVRIIYRRLFTLRYDKVEYSRFGGLFKGTKLVRVPKSFGELENDGEWLAFILMIMITGLTLGIGSVFFML